MRLRVLGLVAGCVLLVFAEFLFLASQFLDIWLTDSTRVLIALLCIISGSFLLGTYTDYLRRRRQK